LNPAEAVAITPARVAVPARIDHFIGGTWEPSDDGRTFETLDPSTNTVVTHVARGSTSEIDRAVAAARAALLEGVWAATSVRERSRALNRVADAIESRAAEIADLESLDTGLPITQARGQAERGAENFRFFADMLVTMNEEAYRVPDRFQNYVIRRPVGVAGLITPWNTPFMLETWKLAPALAGGCPSILKPAEWSPLTANVLAEAVAEAGVPAGMVNVVHGIGEEAGAALVEHPDVRLISFTGETATGETIMREAAPGLKGLSMELGGKSPVVVFADADLDAAVDAAVFGIFSLNGERCTAGSRLLVEASVYEDVVAEIGARARRIRIGAPHDPRTELGPLIHPVHHERVLEYVRAGCDEGARLLAGGGRPDGLQEGNFLEATVFADVQPELRIFQEEIFGPVLCVTPFADEAEALRLGNGVRYGLAAYIWTSDVKRAHRVASSSEAGMVWLNSHNVRDLRTPFGGVKASGVGREGGIHSLDFYCERQIIHVALGDPHTPRFGLGDGPT
jgi:5-carboxymethyl-2-hydroxymuconic-semialdehyde dehydrogenase